MVVAEQGVARPEPIPPDATARYRVEESPRGRAAEVLRQVYQALREKGYNPTSQLVGYLLSGDPTYITHHKNARNLIRTVPRDELLEMLVDHYLHCSAR